MGLTSHQHYKGYVVTLPLDQTQVHIHALFQEWVGTPNKTTDIP